MLAESTHFFYDEWVAAAARDSRMRWALLVSGQCYNGALADYPARGPEQPRASVRARGHDAASCETQREHTKKAYADDGGTPSRTAAAAAMVESSKKSKWSAVPQISVMM